MMRPFTSGVLGAVTAFILLALLPNAVLSNDVIQVAIDPTAAPVAGPVSRSLLAHALLHAAFHYSHLFFP